VRAGRTADESLVRFPVWPFGRRYLFRLEPGCRSVSILTIAQSSDSSQNLSRVTNLEPRERLRRVAARHQPSPGDVRCRSPLSLAKLMVNDVVADAVAVANDLRPVLLRLSRELRKEADQFGVTSRQVTLLWLIRRSPGLSLRELAREEGISAPALSGHVDRLQRLGLIERVRSAADRRRVGLELTPTGSRVLRRVRDRRTAWLAERLRTLEPAALEQVEAAIEPLRRLL
jgi:DNA-binding MarR family transcriptional regulator